MASTMHSLAARADGIGRSRLASLATADARAALLGFLTVAAVGSAHGGYSPTSWGWTAMVLGWLATLALAARPLVRLSWPEAVALAGAAAFAAWTLLSALWTESVPQTALLFERSLVYVAGIAAALLLVRSWSYRALVGGVWAGTAALCCYGLATRLFSGRFPGALTIAGNRLERPLGYWNSLGLLAAFGCILALGLAVHGRGAVWRALAAASLVPLAAALYFTFSRGAWLALALGLLVLVALDPRRLRVVAGLALLGPWAAAGVLVASRQSSLTASGALGPDAVTEGRRLAGILLVLALGAAVASLPLGRVGVLLTHPGYDRRFALASCAAAVVALVAVFVAFGSPVHIAKRGWHAFNAPPVVVRGGSLNARLTSFSGSWRTQLWRVAIDDWRAHPLGGSGAGTYQQQWLAHRKVASQVINAHSLYLETLAELGPVGLAFLLALLAAPLVAAARVRERRLVPTAAAAFVAFLAHAAVDWDWQLTAVALAALLTGAALLAAARADAGAARVGTRGRAALALATVAVAVVAGIGLVGNRAVAASANATAREDYPRAERQARRAIDWAPWSSSGWEALGDAQYQQGELAAARASYRNAIAKDDRDWHLWLDLALTSTGKAQRRAAEHARRLDPLSPELAAIAPALGLGP